MSAISGKDLKKIGYTRAQMNLAKSAARASMDLKVTRGIKETLVKLAEVRNDPDSYVKDSAYGELARALVRKRDKKEHDEVAVNWEAPIEAAIWGADDIEEGALQQMRNACALPVAVAAAQMPDGHQGYGLPIGGVLATRNAVIPYGVGVDIACRVKLTVVDTEAKYLESMRDDLADAINKETAFGMGANFGRSGRRNHEVMDDPAWEDLPTSIRQLKDKAWTQLGSSGSGNHFVEWGEFVIEEEDLGLVPGRYLALLSHSGSRGLGSAIANYYTKVAMEAVRLPAEMKHLAWLDLSSEEGQAYWNAMNLAGRYAHANHECIHQHVCKRAGVRPVLEIENHHNFAWKETHNGEEVVVHRKGATPAGAGELGVIPGTMADPGFIVRGRGNATSLNSAAHGAGRRMSRRKAKEAFTQSMVDNKLNHRKVQLLSAGLDEAPMAYKNIESVMKAQHDLVEVVAQFHPRIVKMAPAGEPAED